MAAALRGIRGCCELGLLVLPSLKAVSEGAELAKNTDGVLLAVRQDKSSTEELKDTIRQLEFAGCHLLGIVYIRQELQKTRKAKTPLPEMEET